ncbi:hypothetical protein ACVIWU_006349 [Bradyrhizobium sp. USDA 4509]
MSTHKPDKEPAKSAVPDRGESTGLMEPMLVSESSGRRTQLADLSVELAAKSAAFRHSLPRGVLISLARLVRSMNCYYSNLIEGHDTHPIDIERALKHDYSADPKKRDLQEEAIAHIAVQEWIDEGGLNGRATMQDGIIEVHRRFCELLPTDLLWVENPDTKERVEVVAGKLRDRDVAVGRHVPVSPGALPRFLTRFEESTQSSPRPAPTTACFGFTRSWMEMAALRGSCPMPCSGKRSTPRLLVHRARPCPQRGDLQATSYCL